MSDSDKQLSADASSSKEVMLAPISSSTSMTQYLPKLTKRWYQYSHFRKLYFWIAVLTLVSTNNGYDGSMLNGLQSLSIWHDDMDNPQGHALGALSNGTTFGTILSTFYISNYIADRWGRVIGVAVGQIIAIVGSILQGASTNYAFFLVSRIILGFGAGSSVISSPSLIAELSYPTHRSSATAFYNTCWYVGSIIAAWVTYGTRVIDNSYCWRLPSYLQGVVPVVEIALIWWIPESPRFLINKGRRDKAEQILTEYHIGDSQDPHDLAFIQFELDEIERALEMEKLASNTSYMDFIKLPAYRKRLFLVWFVATMMQLSGNGLVSYYLNRVLNSINITGETEQLQINGCLMIFNLATAMVASSLVGFFKRRNVFMVSITGMLVCFVIWTALSAEAAKNDYPKALSNGVLAFIFLFYASYNIGMNGLPYVYVTEILPFSHRAKGIAIFQFAQNAVSIYNGYVNVIALDAIDWKYYIFFDVWLAVELVVVFFFFPETSGKTLEEVSEIFDINETKSVPPSISKLEVEHKEIV